VYGQIKKSASFGQNLGGQVDEIFARKWDGVLSPMEANWCRLFTLEETLQTPLVECYLNDESLTSSGIPLW